MADYTIKKRVREDDSSELGLPDVKKIRDDLLGVLDESDPDLVNQDLDSVMKSFEKEISAGAPSSSSTSFSCVVVVDLTSDSGDSQPELGYLLEASDDELGLPPSSCSSEGEEGNLKNELTELTRVDSVESVENAGFSWGFDEQIPSYDSFELGIGEVYNNNNNSNNNSNTEYAAFDDGLFEHSNVCFDYSDYSWRLGTMPAE